MRLFVITLVCSFSLSLAACGDDGLVKDPAIQVNPEDDPTFQCQAMGPHCSAPFSNGLLCCPIAPEPSNDCSMIGGTADPYCTGACDASPESFAPLVQNDDGCWVWEGLSEEQPIPIAGAPE